MMVFNVGFQESAITNWVASCVDCYSKNWWIGISIIIIIFAGVAVIIWFFVGQSVVPIYMKKNIRTICNTAPIRSTSELCITAFAATWAGLRHGGNDIIWGWGKY